MGHRILIVDDSEMIQLTLAALFEDEGYDVVSVGTFDEAERSLTASAYAAILLDVNLGARRGIDLIPAIVARQPGAKIILCTGLDPEDIGAIAHVDAISDKNGDDLLELVASLLRPPPADGREATTASPDP